jgi:hypothetical protein
MRVNVEYSGRLGELGDYCFKDCRGKWGRELNKDATFYDYVFDAFRLAMKYYKFM